MKRCHWLAAALLAASFGAGCTQPNYTALSRYEKGLVIVLSGAGDMMGEVDSVRNGLDEGRVDWALERFTWSQGGVLHDQTGLEHNRRMAARLARRIEGYQGQYPGRPVCLVGISAGTGIVVFALESLHEGGQVARGILLSSSLDSRYDLGAALRHIKDHMYVFRNTAMDVVLGPGVMVTRTVDREGMTAGGLFGFSPPDNAADETLQLYKEKLVQIGWGAGDVLLGNFGGHLGPTSSAFVREKVAPIVLGLKPGEKPPKPAKARSAPAARTRPGKARREAPPPEPPASSWEPLP
jgi:hypothetical protein